MNRTITRVAWLVALTIAACVSQAQGLASIPRFALMMDRGVRAELKLTPAQSQQVDAAMKELMSPDGRGIMIRPGTNLSSIDRKVEAILTPAQRKRLYEVWLQRSGGLALAEPAVAKAVGLTPKQTSQISDIVQEMMSEVRAQAMAQGGGRIQNKGTRDRASKKIEGLLTASQRQRWIKLQGRKFIPAKRA